MKRLNCSIAELMIKTYTVGIMNDTIILGFCIILFVVAHELIRRTALRHIKESNDADESCYYRKRFFGIRLCIAIVFGCISLYVILSGDNIGVNSVMVGLLLAWTSYINKHSLPLSGKRPHDITKSKFILYLRGFAYDDYSLTQKDLSKSQKDLSTFSEGRFINILKQYMPVYAVGMTKELNSPIGAERIYLNDARWESEVMDLMTRASLIVILLNDSQSCIWEICKSNQFKNKAVFISNNSEKLANIRRELNKQYVYPLPIGLKDKTISYFTGNSHETQISEYSNTDKSYRQIIKQLMFKKFRLRRFVFTQKRLNWILGVYGIVLYISWTILILKYNLNTTTAIVWGIFSYVVSIILILFAYNKLYVLMNRSVLKS